MDSQRPLAVVELPVDRLHAGRLDEPDEYPVASTGGSAAKYSDSGRSAATVRASVTSWSRLAVSPGLSVSFIGSFLLLRAPSAT